MNNAQHARLCTALIHGACGDLALDARGDVRYGYDPEKGEKVLHGYGPVLARTTRDGFRLTGDGAEFILENLYEGRSKADMKALENLTRGA